MYVNDKLLTVIRLHHAYYFTIFKYSAVHITGNPFNNYIHFNNVYLINIYKYFIIINNDSL